ncbi:MAG TPA: DinB family protein [Acidimicrobiales bacterium]|nr:DinB family protein [Acidimicrobiales bacterium]
MDPGPCPACGFDPRTVSPADAAVAARSYPRRFRALLVRPEGDEGEEPTPEDLVRRRPPEGGWSALEHTAWVAAVLSRAADALEAIRVRERPQVEISAGEEAVASATELAPVLERLGTAAEGLAQTISRVDARDWTRRGRLADGREVTALEVMHHAVHEGFHHLRETEQVLARLRGRPG